MDAGNGTSVVEDFCPMRARDHHEQGPTQEHDVSADTLTDARPAQPGADGLIAVVKRDCPTCRLVAPVLAQLSAAGVPLTVYSQDDPAFPEGLAPVDDTALELSYRLEIEAVPTVLRIEHGRVLDRLVGW